VAGERERSVRVPDLTGIAASSPPFWETYVNAAVASIGDGAIAVVGHSGAGAFLPAIGHCLGDRLRGVVFVDAQLPPPSGAHRTPPELERLLDENTVDGVLRKWWDWWPAAVLEAEVPDPALRATLRADTPQLPRAFYDESVPVPPGWSSGPCGYVKLSDGYVDEYNEAGRRGWPRTAIEGHHLGIVTAPATVLGAIEDILDRL
jgi:hypothetical protein